MNGELTAKLESEIALEKETRENTDGNSNFLKDEVKEFLDSSGFEVFFRYVSSWLSLTV